jgi:transcriptional repressor NrdR
MHPSRHRPPPLGSGSSIVSIGPIGPIVAPPGVCVASPAGASVAVVRCPSCAGLDDKVVDSRTADDGSAIRRRRECLTCGHRYTTFERLEEVPLMVIKRSGDRVPFDREKIEIGVRAAAKGRPVSNAQIELLASDLEDQARLAGPDIASEQVGLAILERLRDLDEVAYVRFASVYKDFRDASDFQREVGLLTKETAPKRH